MYVMYVCTYVYMYVYLYVYFNSHIFIWTLKHLYIYTCFHRCKHVYIYRYIYINIHIHINGIKNSRRGCTLLPLEMISRTMIHSLVQPVMMTVYHFSSAFERLQLWAQKDEFFERKIVLCCSFVDECHGSNPK